MARCGCSTGGCNCALQLPANSGLTLSGTGQPVDPWVLDTRAIFLGTFVSTTPGAANFNPTASFPGAKWLRVRVIGGGGGGAGATATVGNAVVRGGGSGGNYAEGSFLVASLPVSIPIVVGAGGTGGVAANGAGVDGTASRFNTPALIATGGRGAAASDAVTAGAMVSVGATPLGGSAGPIIAQGQPGFRGIQITTAVQNGGGGGAAAGGLGTGGLGGRNNAAGSNGGPYGGGGGGASSSGTTANAGGDGGVGAVIIEVFR